MVLPNIDILNGITGLEIILSGYILGLILIFKHARKAPNKKVKKNIILSGIGLIGLFQAWFGVSASFVLMTLGFPPLGYPTGDPNVGVLGYAWGPALGIPIWAYIASDLFKKGRYKIPITGIFVVLSSIFAILIYSFPTISTSWNASPGGLPETGIRGAALIVLGLMLVIMMVFLGPTIIISGLKLEDKSAKWRRFMFGIGITMGSLFGIIDAGVSGLPLIGLAIVKAAIFTSIFLIYEGIDKGT
ncbi:MAG: hypothetical protein HWN80_19825 [Candidatus Lokiarchaeota archaeon]|nr:hypothetical protein [Candidatus Lokiarchaeota archaeon]